MHVKSIIGCLVFWLPSFALAGVAIAQDVDADLVPDSFDNCMEVQNGPNEAPNNQVDADGDGYGNACDMDFDQSGYVGLTDHNALWACFGQVASCSGGGFFPVLDVNVDGATTAIDLALLFEQLGAPFAAVSGLSCADPTLNTTLIGGPDPVCD